MSAYTYRMLLVQGYSRDDVTHNPNLNLLARWTPFACGCLGALGLGLRSPAYFWALGTLTLIGAVSSRSFYDYLYQIFLRPLTGLGEMPRHGAPRRFGCAIGACLFILSGTGFYVQSPLLSLIPALIIIPLAFGAAFTQWCFASALYRLISRKKADCCWDERSAMNWLHSPDANVWLALLWDLEGMPVLRERSKPNRR